MKDKDLLKLLLKHGWQDVRQKGSHHVLVKDLKTISLPVHNRDVKPGLLNQILKVARLK